MIEKTRGIATGTPARLALGFLLACAVVGCKTGDQKTEAPAADAGGTPPSSPGNNAPSISGTPVTTAKASLLYVFQPQASDPDGDPLVFEVRSKPDWATFDASTGRLEGTPPPGATGTYTGVQIVVSDGMITTALAPFSISVLEPVSGSAELSWQPPTANDDGSPLSDLAGYVIHYGRSLGALDQSARIENPGITMYVVDDLTEGTWYFSLSAVNDAGVESRPTGYVSKTIG